jgi:H/ACA ribonucleoprotein complex subunit 4
MEDMDKLLNFGLINIDKPAGPTSYSISEFVKNLLGLSKTSHMGTLDPKVSGVLPVTLGRACKLADYFIRHDKTYVGILETHKECNIEELQDLIDDNFVGKIRQTPPKRSAVKIAERIREVYHWKLIESDESGRNFLFECRVEGGTYIRKLCSDLGDMINGAHMGDLRRTEAGIFSEEAIYSLEELEAAVEKWKAKDEKDLKKMIMPAEVAIRKVLPVVQVEKRAVKSLYVGKPLFVNDVIGDTSFEGDFFALFCGKKFIGVYKRNDVRPRSLSPTEGRKIFGRSEFVKTDI